MRHVQRRPARQAGGWRCWCCDGRGRAVLTASAVGVLLLAAVLLLLLLLLMLAGRAQGGCRAALQLPQAQLQLTQLALQVGVDRGMQRWVCAMDQAAPQGTAGA